jgi:biopolymer transport protein ExbD
MEDGMRQATFVQAQAPLGEINTTSLIDVMLVLLIMFVITVPVATHSLDVPLPGESQGEDIRRNNTVVLTSAGSVLWNGTTVTFDQLSGKLALVARMPQPPEVRFRPEATASYGLAAEVLRRIKLSGVETFGLVGNEAYADFPKR